MMNMSYKTKEEIQLLCTTLSGIESSLRNGIEYTEVLMTKENGEQEPTDICVMSREIMNETTDWITRARTALEYLNEKRKDKKEHKRPPARLPCICGRKRLDVWYSGSDDGIGMFIRCPKCDRESPVVRYKTQLNEAWNNFIQEEAASIAMEKTILEVEEDTAV